METSKTSFLNISLKNALILGGIFILFSVMVYVLDINMFSIMFSIVYFLIIFGTTVFFMVKSMNYYKRNLLDGKITYLQCFLTGFVMSVVAMWIAAIFGYIMYGLIDTEYMPKQIDKFAEMLQGYNMPADKIEEQLLKVQDKMNPVKQIISSLYMSPIASAIIAAIVSIFIKKNDENISQDVLR